MVYGFTDPRGKRLIACFFIYIVSVLQL